MSDLPLSRTDKSTFPPRTPWRPGFPEVVIHATVAARDRHADYAAAKAGDAGSALTLSRDLLSRVAIDTLESLVAAPGAVLLPVTAVELAGFNAIPDAMAQIIALTLGWRLSAGEVLQNNRVGHTRAAAFNRFVTPAAFDGPVEADSNYVLVDDHVGLGGTLANLKGYIESAGGRVVAMTTLTESREARHIALHSTNLEMLRMRHGEELEKCLFIGVDRKWSALSANGAFDPTRTSA